VTDFGAEHRGAIQWRRQHQKRDGTTAAERADNKRHLQELRRRAAAGDLRAKLALLAGAVPRGRR
jgi:hypothetical protein